MNRRRILPEAAYDFWAEDGYDGEKGPVRDSLAHARSDAKVWRADSVKWKRCRIKVWWRVNERKVLALLNHTDRA
jgi:hypothetical protein